MLRQFTVVAFFSSLVGIGLGAWLSEPVTGLLGPLFPRPMVLKYGMPVVSALVTLCCLLLWFYFRTWRRTQRIIWFLRTQERKADYLKRLPYLGADEMGQIGELINRIFAKMTSLRVDMIDQKRELIQAQQELQLKQKLSEKTEELEQRLKERALLFEILNISASEKDLTSVLQGLVNRLGPALRLGQLAIFLVDEHEKETKYVLRAAFGFTDPKKLEGKVLLAGQGLVGSLPQSQEPYLFVQDVRQADNYKFFWGQALKEGSFAGFPIRHRERVIGILACTRPSTDLFSELELRLLQAISDQMAVAIRNAQLFDDLHELSTHDELTGLANRRLLRGQIKMELERTKRYRNSFSVLMLDIDHFKMLNDRHGHSCGDKALRKMAALMTQMVRSADTVARVGGEEFVILLPQTTIERASEVAEKIRTKVEEVVFEGGAEQPKGVLTVSVGVTQAKMDDTTSKLLARADQAMYQAKKQGRNQSHSIF